GRTVPKGTRVLGGDRIALPALRLEPEPDLPVRVVHLDERLVAVDKPGGMPSHALDPRQPGTVAGFLAGRFPETAVLGDARGSGLPTRPEPGTSGLRRAARTAESYESLREAFRSGAVGKRYLALVAGVPEPRVTIDRPLAHDPEDRRRMVPARPG